MKGSPALVELLHVLRLHNYSFTAVTPKTHAAVLSHPSAPQPDLRDIFGWNRPFAEADLEALLLSLLYRAGALSFDGAQLTSRVRVASLGEDLLVHSGFPTDERDAVFFGPDSYRFAKFLRRNAETVSNANVIVDMGAGSGAGGIAAARLAPEAEVILVDVNAKALQFAEANAAAAGLTPRLVESDQIPNDVDLLIANPPYLMDASARTYRDGGGLLGGAVSLDWVSQGLDKLRPGGTILLYTGAAYVNGRSPLIAAISQSCRFSGADLSVEEIDPDVFGEELLEDVYAGVERIAALGIKIRRSSR